MLHPKSEPTARGGSNEAPRRAVPNRLEAILGAVGHLVGTLLGPPPWRGDAPVEIAIAWTHTQLSWSAPTRCARGPGGLGDSP